MDKQKEHVRKSHQSSLAVWAVTLKVLAWLCWILGVVVAIVQVSAMSSMSRSFDGFEEMEVPGRSFLGATMAISLITTLLAAIVAGAVLWAIAHGLTSLGQIEENTRIAAKALGAGGGPSEPTFSQ